MSAWPDMTVGFIVGILTAGFLAAAIFFLRFFTRTRDRLFLAFSAAFLLLALNAAAPIVFGIPEEAQGLVYLVRMAAFVLIIIAVLWKNLPRSR